MENPSRTKRIAKILGTFESQRVARHTRVVFAATIFAFALTIIYLPWQNTHYGDDRPAVITPAGFHFILSPPSPLDPHTDTNRFHNVDINYLILLFEWLALANLAGVALLLRR